MKQLKSGTIAALLLCAMAANAQDGPLRGSVNVDGKYLPDVIRQDRVNTLPRQYTFKMESMTLDYDKKGVTTPFSPSFSALPVTGWKTDRKIRDYNGYVGLNLGSWLNSSISAGYRPLHTSTDDLAVWLQHNSSSLFKPKMSEATKDVTQQRYDETVGLNYAHTFNDNGRLDFGFDYHFRYFNYYGFKAPGQSSEGVKSINAPSQTANDIATRIGWASIPSSPFQYDATLNLRYFGFRRLYMYDPLTPTHPSSFKGEKETHVNLDGGLVYSIDNSSSFGAKVRIDALGYNTPDWREQTIDSYGRFGVTPYYRFTRGNLDISLGAAIDLTFDAGPEDNRFGAFHIAPDLRLDYRSGFAGLYVHLLGGTHLNTLAEQADMDYYGVPALLSTTPSYTPLDGKIGINFGPMAGVTAGLAFAYKYVNNQPLMGLYTMYLNNTPVSNISPDERVSLLYPDGMKVHGWSVQANIGFDITDKVNLALNGSYQPQKGTTGYWNGIDRPRWLLDAACTFSPIDPLHITVQYSYRGVRNVYAHVSRIPDIESGITTGGNGYDNGFRGIRLPDVTDVALRASYNITPAFSVSLQADNLLNRKIQLLPDVISQGVNILGGLQFTF